MAQNGMRAGIWERLIDPQTAERALTPPVIFLFCLGTILALLGRGDAFDITTTILLLIVAMVCWRIYALREKNLGKGAWIWLFVAFGFFFLALDDAFSIHENADRLFHSALGITPNELTDRLDDMIVLGYGIAGAIFLYLYREEFRVLFWQWKLMAGGSFLFVVMVVLDVMTNRPEALSRVLPSSSFDIIFETLKFAEDFVKVIAAVMFLYAFLRVCREIDRRRIGGITRV